MYRPTDTPSDIYIWDWVVRLCHWGLVATFVTNYFIVEPGRLYHEIAGYMAVALISIRIGWGILSTKFDGSKRVATEYASFSKVSLRQQAFAEHIQHVKQKKWPQPFRLANDNGRYHVTAGFRYYRFYDERNRRTVWK